MEPHVELAKKYSEHSVRDLGHSALPDAPVQPYRRRLGQFVGDWLRRWIATRPERPPREARHLYPGSRTRVV